MKVFASCSSYSLGVLTTSREACDLLSSAVGDLEHEQLVPAVHALRELRALADVELRVDGGAQLVAKARSRHFAAALNSTCDVWLTIDDDVDTTRETLALLLAAVEPLQGREVGPNAEPHVCFAPYMMRNDPTVAAVEWPSVYVDRQIRSPWATKPGEVVTSYAGSVRRAVRGGFGLVAMNRAALELIAERVPRFKDDDGEMKPAAFLEVLTADGQWLGEDYAFYSRCSGIVVEALITGETTHAGVRLDLSTLK